LQYGADNVTAGGVIYAAAGTYLAESSSSDQVLLIDRGVHVFGGWQRGTGPADLVVDPRVNISIIDGQNSRRGVTVTSPSDSSLSGFTIRNGNATMLNLTLCPETKPSGCGGGLLASGAFFSVNGCIIENNRATTVSNADYSTGYGGGIYIFNPIGIMIKNSTIRNNIASSTTDVLTFPPGQGGGLYFRGVAGSSGFQLQDTTISGNDTALSTEADTGLGAGVAVVNDNEGVIRNNIFKENNANENAAGSALYILYSSTLLQHNQIVDNHFGVVLYLEDFNGSVKQNVIINPEASVGMYHHLNSPGNFSIVENNIIAHHSGANLYAAGVIGFPVTVNLYHNTIDDSPDGLLLGNYASIIFSNGIVSHTLTGFDKFGTMNVNINVSHTLFHDNTFSDGSMDINLNPIYGDPAYVDPAHWDYHLQSGSAARDSSINAGYAYDFESDPRPMGSGTTPYDVGADEFWWKFWLPMIQNQ
jgi:hypothetical protein